MKECFPYSKEASKSLGFVHRPIAKIGLRDLDNKPFEISVVVDSGADISLFSKRIGDIIGINVEDGQERRFRGIAGELIAYVHKIPMKIGDKEIDVTVAFALADVPNLLGRLDIFDTFDLNFLREKKVCFEC